MAGPKTRKWTCARCSHYRWCEDFGGASAKDLDEYSVCDFCLLEEKLLSELRSQAERFQTQLKEMETAHQDQLKKMETEHQAQLKKMETELKAVLHSSEEGHGSQEEKKGRKKKQKKKKKAKKNLERPVGSSVAAVLPGETSRAVALHGNSSDKSSGSGYVSFGVPMDDKEDSSKAVTGEEKGGAPHGEAWKVVTSKKKKKKEAMKKAKESTRGVSTPWNGVHGNLFGDSQVKGIHSLLNKSEMRGVRVTSLPGKGNKDIRREVEKSTADKSGVAIIIASGNDLYKRSGSVGNTTPIILDVMGAVDDAEVKAHRRVVVGIIPRLRRRTGAYSKNIGINNSLKDLCSREGVTFVDPYDEFFSKPDLFKKDGVHLNGKGQAKLVALVKKGCWQAGLGPGNSEKKQQHGLPQKNSVSSRTVRQEVGDSDSRVSGNVSS